MRKLLATLSLSVLFLACAHSQPEAPQQGSAAASGGTCKALAAASTPAGKYAFRLHLQSGESRTYKVEVKLHTKVTSNDAPLMDSPMTMSYTEVLETGATGASGATALRQRFADVKVAAEGQMGEMMKSMVEGLGKVTVVTELCPDGTAASTKLEGDEGNPMLQGMAKQMAQGARFSFLPKTAVGPGDTWSTEEKTEGQGMGGHVQLVIKSTLRFVGVEACGTKQCAHIESDSETAVPEGQTADLSTSGKGHSVLLIELDSGRPAKSEGNQATKFQGSQQGQTFEGTTDMSYSAELAGSN